MTYVDLHTPEDELDILNSSFSQLQLKDLNRVALQYLHNYNHNRKQSLASIISGSAATAIQSAYRGHRVRQTTKQLLRSQEDIQHQQLEQQQLLQSQQQQQMSPQQVQEQLSQQLHQRHHYQQQQLHQHLQSQQQQRRMLQKRQPLGTPHQSVRHVALNEIPDEERQALAALKIQHAFRRHRRQFLGKKLEAAAIKIQTRMRVKLALRQKEMRRRENEAAKKIQTAFKRYRRNTTRRNCM